MVLRYNIFRILFSLLLSFSATYFLAAQEHGTTPQPAATEQHHSESATVPSAEMHTEAAHDAGHAEGGHEEKPFSPGETALHHISDANSFHIIGDVYFHLPCFLYAPNFGWTFISSTSKFEPQHHGYGTKAIDGYVLDEGSVKRVNDESFPKGTVDIGAFTNIIDTTGGKEKEISFVEYQGKKYQLDKKTTWDGGLMGGGTTSFYDFSITKNVFTMLLTFFVLFFFLYKAARAYALRPNQAPSGVQGFIEPLIIFIRDEVAKPMIGPNYEKYMPYLLSAFFFILGLNLIGQIPFFPGSANVTGNISITIVMAVITFLIVNFSGNKHYWEHILWMPGVPSVLKILILTPVEILGVFLKPFTLLLRLFANITAGHIVIISFVSLIFIFGEAGKSIGGSTVGALISVPLTLFMGAIELLVAFLQAFIFTMLSASYIGAAIEEPHHH